MTKVTAFVENFLRNMSYYAVAKGRFPGVYFSWLDCKKQVDQYPGAKFRKFSTEAEARNFVSQFANNSTQITNPNATPGGGVAIWNTHPGSVHDSLNVTVSQNPVSCISTNRHKDEASTASETYKRLSQLEEKQDEVTKQIRGELDELRENFHSLDARLSKIESKILDKSDMSHAVIKSKIDDINKVERIFEEEFGLLRERIKALKTQKTEVVGQDGDSESRRRLLKEILFEETKPKLLGNRPCGSTSASVITVSEGGKRKYSTESTQNKSVKLQKIDYSHSQEPVNVPKLTSSASVSSNFPFIINDEGYVEVYTDGACEKNGRKGAKAGVGVWFGDNHPLNISEPVVGRATNNTAEIQAATYAVETAKKAGVKMLLVHTDSNFLINCITKWIKKWKKNNWRVQDGDPVKNKDELIVLENKLQGIDVKWNHVRGHRGLHGNEMADHLAREGAKRYVQIACDEDF